MRLSFWADVGCASGSLETQTVRSWNCLVPLPNAAGGRPTLRGLTEMWQMTHHPIQLHRTSFTNLLDENMRFGGVWPVRRPFTTTQLSPFQRVFPPTSFYIFPFPYVARPNFFFHSTHFLCIFISIFFGHFQFFSLIFRSLRFLFSVHHIKQFPVSLCFCFFY